jgi:hypothetical protein
VRFLLAREGDGVPGRVLIVQTANPNLLDHVTRDVLARFPGARTDVLLQRGMRPWIVFHDGVTYLDNADAAGRRALLDALRAARYDVAVTVLSGEAGYWKLKLLPLLIAPTTVRVYDRFARSFPLNVYSFAAYLAEVLGGIAGAANPGGITPRLVLRKLAAPGIALYLWAYLRRRRLAGPREPDRVSDR